MFQYGEARNILESRGWRKSDSADSDGHTCIYEKGGIKGLFWWCFAYEQCQDNKKIREKSLHPDVVAIVVNKALDGEVSIPGEFPEWTKALQSVRRLKAAEETAVKFGIEEVARYKRENEVLKRQIAQIQKAITQKKKK